VFVFAALVLAQRTIPRRLSTRNSSRWSVLLPGVVIPGGLCRPGGVCSICRIRQEVRSEARPAGRGPG
jgi:hypothetical protein